MHYDLKFYLTIVYKRISFLNGLWQLTHFLWPFGVEAEERFTDFELYIAPWLRSQKVRVTLC